MDLLVQTISYLIAESAVIGNEQASAIVFSANNCIQLTQHQKLLM
ncbi:hypothetical protein AB6E77_14715 [Vibrio sp. 10N.247.311.18]